MKFGVLRLVAMPSTNKLRLLKQPGNAKLPSPHLTPRTVREPKNTPALEEKKYGTERIFSGLRTQKSEVPRFSPARNLVGITKKKNKKQNK